MDAQGKTLEIKRGEMAPGDRLLALGGDQAVLAREAEVWGCDCTEWEWDCEEGPNGTVWCTKVCVKYVCTPVPAFGGFRA